MLEKIGLTPVRLGLILTIICVYFVFIPLFYADSKYILIVLINAAIASVISMGVWITFSIGRINISQGVYALIGGYVTAILLTRYDFSFWLAMPLSGLAAAFIGAMIGFPILRLKGVYFAMLTLSMTEVGRLVAINWESVTRGALGIVNIPRPSSLHIAGATVEFSTKDVFGFYLLSGIVMVLAMLFLWRLNSSRIGLIFRSLRQNEELASSLGINIVFYRILAYSISCFLGGTGGSFFAVFHQNIYPDSYKINDSVFYMIYCFLGGLEYILGAIVGTYLLTISFEFLHALQEFQTLIYGILMIVIMLLLPSGILSFSFKSFRKK